MDYELAKRLENAGFLQPDGTRGKLCNGESDPEQCPYAPTLPELIEACGEKFIRLDKIENGKWVTTAKTGFKYPRFDWVSGEGPTPEEAVANLWLALNSK